MRRARVDGHHAARRRCERWMRGHGAPTLHSSAALLLEAGAHLQLGHQGRGARPRRRVPIRAAELLLAHLQAVARPAVQVDANMYHGTTLSKCCRGCGLPARRHTAAEGRRQHAEADSL